MKKKKKENGVKTLPAYFVLYVDVGGGGCCVLSKEGGNCLNCNFIDLSPWVEQKKNMSFSSSLCVSHKEIPPQTETNIIDTKDQTSPAVLCF